MKNLLIAGYSAFDLGIFKNDDPKLQVIQEAIRNRLENYRDNGVEWLIFGGNLGFEYWTFMLAGKEFPELLRAVIFPFETTGQNWNEANQAKLGDFKQAEFVKYCFSDYENPRQFRTYDEFLIENSDGALVLYDEERESEAETPNKLHFRMDQLKAQADYPVDFISFEELQETAENLAE
ncbi:MAG: SLOG family protein [Streptococcaceae bacterium]|jgi:uncharacterized phage-like protein YoqJ|nr:SLOG family protein [Streptococcaceae bacterium]